MRIRGPELFVFTLIVGIYVLLHWAVYRFYSQLIPVSPVLIIALALLSIACLFNKSDNGVMRVMYFIGMSWMGALFMLFLFIFPLALLRIAGLYAPWLLIAPLIVVLYSYYAALLPKVKKVKVETGKLRKQMRIVQLSDMHLGAIYGKAWLTRVLQQVREAKPDVVVITGDLFDGPVLRDAMLAPFTALNVPVLFITGNHEEYGGLDRVLRIVERSNLHLLDGKQIVIDGVQFSGAAYRAKAPKPSGKVNVLLKHLPIPEGIFDLQLSGHTHHGQIWPLNYAVLLQFDMMSGVWNMQHGTLYTSQGTGTWGPPMRLGSRSEITLITLS